MAEGGLRIGSVLGAPVLLRPSWFLVGGLVTVAFVPTVVSQVPGSEGLSAYLVSAAFAIMLLGSVFLHELAHAVAARFAGTPPTHIVLDVWGGHTAFSADLPTPGRSILVAAVGPATNALIGLGAGWARTQLAPTGLTDLLLLALALSNAFVAGFNALPGLPLDGGRVLEGLVWWIGGERHRGTLVAGWFGRLLALVLAGYVLIRPTLTGARFALTSAVWLLVVAVVLWQGASQAIRVARWRRRAPTLSVDRLLRPAIGVQAGAMIGEAVSAARAHGVADVVLLDIYGRPSAVLDQAGVATVPAGREGAVPVSAVARPLRAGATLPVRLAGESLVDRMQDAPQPEYVVVDDGGVVVGVLRWADVASRLAGH